MRLPRRRVAAVAASVLATMVLGVPAHASAPTAPRIDWQRCQGAVRTDAVRCGQVSVPLDWSRPAPSARTTVAVARLPAADPEHRLGTLMFNPGGPGEGEVGYLLSRQARRQYFPEALRDRFDIVAVEPRGTGVNPPLNCPLPVDHTVSRFPADRPAAAALVTSNRRMGTVCARRGGPVFPHLDTASVARDMDTVRAALGESRISFLGVSYGTMVAQSYAERFPSRVRAMVLDGVVDRSLSWRRLARVDAAAVQDGVRRFARWSDRDDRSALHGRDVTGFLASLLRRADHGGIKDSGRPVRAEEIAQAVNAGLQSPSLYAPLATALDRADADGDMAPLVFLTPGHTGEYGLYRSIVCQDVPGPEDPGAALPAAVPVMRAAGPALRGYSEFWDIASGCAGWPVGSAWTPHAWRVPAHFPAVLLLSGTHDVATPPAFADGVRRALPSSRLLRWDGDGHTAWLNSPVTVDAAVGYLTTLRMPDGAR
ncbi:alpha/beta hydrolase [Streptomyces sp. NPDC049099]|uniref:alpha/beta hydrolase n=1 Tax=Streptomyces sp. NPDC049099 TaxID=3155768 RepID=UPI003430BC0A